MTDRKKIVLASQSLTRRRILQQLGLDFEVVPSDFEEDLTQPISHEELVQQLALGKAREVAANHAKDVVIGADALIVVDDERLAKPTDADDARRMLRSLRGRQHSSITGVAVLSDGREAVRAVTTGVTFRNFSDVELEAYVKSGEPMGKAGGYAVQERAGLLLERIDGDLYSVAGLPLGVLAELFQELGISDYLFDT